MEENVLPEISLDGITIDADIDFDIADFDLVDDAEKTRILKPKMARSAVYTSVSYTYARHLADKVSMEPGSRTTVIVPGNFIFGDLLEALILDRGIDAQELIISTLSMSQENVDSLKTIMMLRPSMRLTLILSGYFYSHEKHGVIPYLYRELDMGDRFQAAFTNTHMKVALIASAKGGRYTITGSANMRSSSSIEQFDIDEDAERYDFFRAALTAIAEKYKTIDYTVPIIGRGADTWQAVQAGVEGKAAPPSRQQRRRKKGGRNG